MKGGLGDFRCASEISQLKQSRALQLESSVPAGHPGLSTIRSSCPVCCAKWTNSRLKKAS